MNKSCILIIDDEPQIRKLLSIALESNHYQVSKASTAKQGIIQAANHPPELILLDINLPDENGQDVLKHLRLWYEKPIIMLSVLNNEQEIVKALDNGATDYLSKPFRTAELLARIRSAIRRNNHPEQMSCLQTGELRIDLAARTLKKKEELIKLTATEFNLLALLARNEGRVLTHHFLLKEVWGLSFQNETQYLRVFIAALRKKIEENPVCPRHIITENGVGYRFQ